MTCSTHMLPIEGCTPCEGQLEEESRLETAGMLRERLRIEPLIEAVEKILDSTDRQGHVRGTFAFNAGTCKCRWCEGMRALDKYREGR
jgi:hypothetical protein